MAAVVRPANTSLKAKWSCRNRTSPRVIVLGLIRCFENSVSAVEQKLLSQIYSHMAKRPLEKLNRRGYYPRIRVVSSEAVYTQKVVYTEEQRGWEKRRSIFPNSTRLISFIRGILSNLSAKIRGLQRNLPVKILFFPVGFYCKTAFATVIVQTGDWDILSSALAVLVVEGIGALTYKASLNLLERARSLITMFNYWKAGLSLGLFLDSFKYDKGESLTGLYSILNLEFDIFPPT